MDYSKITVEERKHFEATTVPITPKSLTDTWNLVPSKSNSIKKLYQAANPGNHLLGKYLDVASSRSNSQVITLTDRELSVKIVSHGFKVAREAYLIGADYEQITKGDLIGRAAECTFYNQDKTVLTTTTKTKNKGTGKKERRLVEGGETLIIDYEWTKPNGDVIKLSRVFKKKSSNVSEKKSASVQDNECFMLVIGGAGFLGLNLVEHILTKEWDVRVRIFDIRPPAGGILEHPRVEFKQGNICEIQDLVDACENVHTIFHTASPPEGRSRELYLNVNVKGTNNVIEAAKRTGVKQIVFTSTASVVFDGKDIVNGDESLPYVTKYLDPYIETKIMAEKAVLAANGPDLKTCAIRPSGIFGPKDAQAWPGIIEAAKAGKSKYQIGSGKNMMDWTFVENVSYAHCLAAEKLVDDDSPVGGQAFFITNDQPLPFWEMPKYVYKNLGYPGPKYVLPTKFIVFLAIIVDFILWLISPIKVIKSTLTYFRVILATKNRSFNIKKAKELLGYTPIVPLSEGMAKTLEYFKSLENK